MTSLEKKVRSFLEQNNITLSAHQVNLLLLLCPGVERNLFLDARDFARFLPPIAELLEEHAGELFAELVAETTMGSSTAEDNSQSQDDTTPSTISSKDMVTQRGNLFEDPTEQLVSATGQVYNTPVPEGSLSEVLPTGSTGLTAEIGALRVESVEGLPLRVESVEGQPELENPPKKGSVPIRVERNP